jgi:hypothetical protein
MKDQAIKFLACIMITQLAGCRNDSDKDESQNPVVTRNPDGAIWDGSVNVDDSPQAVSTRFVVSDVIREKIGLTIMVAIYNPYDEQSDDVMFTIDQVKPTSFEVRSPTEFSARITFTFHEDGRLKGWVTGMSENCPDIVLNKYQEVELVPEMLCETAY